MGQRAAHEGEVAHAGQADIGDELAASAQERSSSLRGTLAPMPLPWLHLFRITLQSSSAY